MEIGETLFAKTAADFRRFLIENGQTKKEIWLVIYKKSSGRSGLSYEAAVDEALCFGWIDGMMKSMDREKYAQRFTPRRPHSHWTEANLVRARRLIAAGKMTASGRAVLPEEFKQEADMANRDLIQTFVDYHLAMSNRVWESIEQITEQQFLQEDPYSRGSIRNLMVHLANTDRSWLAGLKNLPDVRGQLKKYEEYPDRTSVRTYGNSISQELGAYVHELSEADLNSSPIDIPGPRWEVLLHLVNHGTDHRATVLQRLNEFGAPTFDQDFILWRMNP